MPPRSPSGVNSGWPNSLSPVENSDLQLSSDSAYRNRVNVRRDSDVDVGVMLYEYFLSQYPEGNGGADFNNVSADYSFLEFKKEVEEALVARFGRAAVKRGNKAFNIKETTHHVEADVVPLFEFRHYWKNGTYRAGVALIPDQGGRIENYPERLVDYWPSTPLHYENGVSKNGDTSRCFKGIVRIIKKIRNEMEEAGYSSAKVVPGYLLECMIWNVPNVDFSRSTWDLCIQAVLLYIWSNTKDDERCKTWCEVDDIKYLFRASQPWTRQAAHTFIDEARDYIGVRLS